MTTDSTEHWWDKTPENTTLGDQLKATTAVTLIFGGATVLLAAAPHLVDAGVSKFRKFKTNRAAKKEAKQKDE